MNVITINEAPDVAIQICAKGEGLDEKPGLLNIIEAQEITKEERQILINELRVLCFEYVDVTNPNWIEPLKERCKK
jgi:hypothetical protein